MCPADEALYLRAVSSVFICLCNVLCLKKNKKTAALHVYFLLFVQRVAVASRAYTPVLVNDVADDERREEEQVVAGHGALRLDVDLVDGDDFALGRGRLSHHLQTSSQSVSSASVTI